MTRPLTERQADQLTVEAMRAENLERALANGPAVLPEDRRAVRACMMAAASLGASLTTKQAVDSMPPVTPPVHSETVRELEAIRSELDHE